LRWYELDPSGWVIAAMAKLGLAWDVVAVSPEKQRAKLVGVSPADVELPEDAPVEERQSEQLAHAGAARRELVQTR
ncbi:MAG TPA: hypothetical protein VMB51_13800, partial [Solirubrobacteraceae bacterium]|nr:hypothetical protein [Solirubrobacteraceae bacterium]